MSWTGLVVAVVVVCWLCLTAVVLQVGAGLFVLWLLVWWCGFALIGLLRLLSGRG